MPIAQNLKMEAIRWLNGNAVAVCRGLGDQDPLIFYMGDQNTFFDDGGQEMMDEFAKAWTHLTPHLHHTFKSFPHDLVQTTSMLDHIFVNHCGLGRFRVASLAQAIDTGASDHFMIVIDIDF
jgi:endonuclease/exonuclease/phosphatase family metal-dependent hydrolase